MFFDQTSPPPNPNFNPLPAVIHKTTLKHLLYHPTVTDLLNYPPLPLLITICTVIVYTCIANFNDQILWEVQKRQKVCILQSASRTLVSTIQPRARLYHHPSPMLNCLFILTFCFITSFQLLWSPFCLSYSALISNILKYSLLPSMELASGLMSGMGDTSRCLHCFHREICQPDLCPVLIDSSRCLLCFRLWQLDLCRVLGDSSHFHLNFHPWTGTQTHVGYLVI